MTDMQRPGSLTRSWPYVDLPLHREALRKAIMEESHGQAAESTRQSGRRTARRIGLVLAPAVAIGVAVVLLVTMMGPSVTGQQALAGARKWYDVQKSKGRWEHTVMEIDTHANLFGKLLLHKYVFESWHDSVTGNDKAVITDPKTGKTIETMIAIKDPAIAQNYGPSSDVHYYKVFSDKPMGESSYVETTHPEDAGLDEESIVPDDGYGEGTAFMDGLGIVTSSLFSAPPGPGGTPRVISPVESNIADRMGLLDGQIGEAYIKRGILQVTGEETIGESGTRALVLAVKLPIEEDTENNGFSVNTSIFVEPGTFAYLGSRVSLTKDGKVKWTDSVEYYEYEFTEKAPDMSTGGMRQIAPVGIDWSGAPDPDANPIPQNGMWPGRPSW